MKNIIIISIISIIILGCSTKQIEIKSEPVQRTKLNLQQPMPISLDKVEFTIITEDNQKQVFSELQKQNKDKVLYGLSEEDYKNLSLNISKIKGYIIEQKSIINSYKDYYEED